MEQSKDIEQVNAEVVETKKEKAKDRFVQLRDEKGRLLPGQPAHPLAGRIKGIPNKFTQIKIDLIDAFKKANGKQKFLDMLNSKDPADFKWAMERIIAILPREQILDIGANGGAKVLVVIQDSGSRDESTVNGHLNANEGQN